MEKTREQQIDELRELVKDIDIAMFTTQHGGRQLHSRPLSTQQVDADGMIWFLTSRQTPVVGEVHHQPAICLTYVSHSDNTYVCVSGRAEESHDQAKISELWSPMHAVFFKGGREDPGLTLLRVTPDHAEVWSGPSSTVGKILAFAAAAITGEGDALGNKHDLAL